MCNLILDDGLILKGNRIVVPEVLKLSVFGRLHKEHQEKQNAAYLQGCLFSG